MIIVHSLIGRVVEVGGQGWAKVRTLSQTINSRSAHLIVVEESSELYSDFVEAERVSLLSTQPRSAELTSRVHCSHRR